MTDAEFNMDKARRMKEIDRILDKIKSSGYGSLTSEEKRNCSNKVNKVQQGVSKRIFNKNTAFHAFKRKQIL